MHGQSLYWYTEWCTVSHCTDIQGDARSVTVLIYRVMHGQQYIKHLTPEWNPSAQRCLTRFFTWDFDSWTQHFVNIWVKNQQKQQLFIQFINYIWCLLHVFCITLPSSEPSKCLLRDAQLRSSRKNIVDGRVVSSGVVRATRNAPWRWQCNAETYRSHHT
jgi:hypothetical protein